MGKTTVPKFRLGDLVRVKYGASDPDYTDMPFGGWSGKIIEVGDKHPIRYLLMVSEQTLKQVHPIYFNRCERDGLHANRVYQFEDDLDPDVGTPVEIEQPTGIITRPLNMNKQDDRILAVFGLTSDDLPPSPDERSLDTYYQFLVKRLKFPFEAKYSFEASAFAMKTFTISVLGLMDREEFTQDEYGLFCHARREGSVIQVPVTELEMPKKDPNRQLIEDYSSWFVNG